jgi:hypothetical protein
MRKFILIFCLSFTSLLMSQVGIGTTTPNETLEVNGTLRVNTTNQSSVTTTKLGGLDGDGTYREVIVGANLELKDNILNAKNGFDHSFGSITFTVKTNDNVDLLLGPGEANEGKTIIRVFNTTGKTEIMGITDGYDGQHIWLFAQDDTVDLIGGSSTPQNNIEGNAKKSAAQWAMIELVYDGLNSKWFIMQNHGG